MMNNKLVFPTYAEVTRFLHNDGWTITQSNANFVLFQSSDTLKDDNGDFFRVMLPSEAGFVDEYRRIATVLELLAAIKNIPIDTLIFLIKNQKSDILEQRIFCSETLSGIPLELMANITGSLRELIYYAACVTEKNSAYITSKKRKIGLECMKKCLFAHTFPGSFGIRLEMPLIFNPSRQFPEMKDVLEEPFERRLMKRIYRGLDLATQGVTAGDVTLVSSNNDGFNANMCEIMSNLFESLSSYNYTLGYRLLWSKEYNIPDNYKREFNISPAVYKDYFASAAKSLRAVGESKRETITGRVIGLHCNAGSSDSVPDFQENYIILLFRSSENKQLQARISLSEDNYKKACEAHLKGELVQVTGILEKSKSLFQMTEIVNFKTLSRE